MVIGLYHHKSSAPLTAAHVAEQAHKLGFEFPVATDPQWATLRRWWLDQNDNVDLGDILLDRQGESVTSTPADILRSEPGYGP